MIPLITIITITALLSYAIFAIGSTLNAIRTYAVIIIRCIATLAIERIAFIARATPHIVADTEVIARTHGTIAMVAPTTAVLAVFADTITARYYFATIFATHYAVLAIVMLVDNMFISSGNLITTIIASQIIFTHIFTSLSLIVVSNHRFSA
jgi:hypothetical protein